MPSPAPLTSHGEAGKTLDIKAEPQWGTMSNRTWDTSVWVADNQKARSALGWQPSYSLKRGFQAMVSWFRDQPAMLRFYWEHS